MSRHAVALLLATFVLIPGSSMAGSNFGGTAMLSWSPVAQISDRGSVSGGQVPLYLLLDGVSDVQALAVEIDWLPYNLLGPRFYLLPADSAKSGCGATAYIDPPRAFDGDSTYTWQIAFAGPVTNCVEYLVAGENSENAPASFCLISVKAMDSDSAIDELTIAGGAMILGGDSTGCPVVAGDIYPHVAILGGENTFRIQARGLTSDPTISLIAGDAVVSASSVKVDGDSMATASVEVPAGLSGKIDVAVTISTSSDTLRGRVAVVDSTSGLAPVWDLVVSETEGGSRVTEAANEFLNPAYPREFPVPDVVLRKVVSHSVVYRDHVSPAFDIQAALLEVDANGRPAVSAPEYVSNACLSVDPDGPHTKLLLPGPKVSAEAIPTGWSSRAKPLAIPQRKDEVILEWEQAPDDSWYVVHTLARTVAIGGASRTALLEVPARSFYGVFSADASRFAAVLESGSAVRWFVADRSGAILREGEPVVGEVSQLRLSSDGRVLAFQRQKGSERVAEAVAVDIATGEETLVAVPAGTRYYSADGKTMLVLVPYPAALHLFDVSYPLSPIQLAAIAPPVQRHLITGAVSPDGSLVAVQMIDDEDNPLGNLTRVVAFDRTLTQKAVVARHVTTEGLQFEDMFLFVGIQRHPIPAWLTLVSTTRIQVFDLSGL